MANQSSSPVQPPDIDKLVKTYRDAVSRNDALAAGAAENAVLARAAVEAATAEAAVLTKLLE